MDSTETLLGSVVEKPRKYKEAATKLVSNFFLSGNLK